MSVFGSGAGAIGTGILYTLQDQFSQPADQIMAKWQKLEGVTDSATASIGKSLNNMKLGVAALAVAGAIMLPLGAAIQEAADYETQFMHIKHTVKTTAEGYKELSDSLRDVARNGTTSLDALAEGAEMAGKLGLKGTESITEYASAVAKFSGWANLSVTESSMLFKRLSQVLDIPLSKVKNMGGAILELGENFAASSGDILGFSAKIAASGKITGMSAGDIFGLSTAFVAAGADSGRGANAVAKALFKMNDAVNVSGKGIEDFAAVAGMSVTDFSNKFKNDPVQAFQAFVKGLGTSGDKAISLMDELDLSDIRMKQLFITVANSGDNLTNAIKLGNKAFAEGNGIQEHSAMMLATLNAQSKMLDNNMKDLKISVGEMFLPAMMILNKVIVKVVQAFNWLASSMVGRFIIGLVATVGVLAGVFGVLLIVMGAVRFLTAQAALTFAKMGMAEVATAFATGSLTAGFSALATAIWTALSPFLPLIIAGLLLTGIIVFLVKSVNAFSDVMEGKAEPATGGWLRVMQKIGGVLSGIGAVFSSAGSEGFSMSEKMRDSLQKLGILDLVLNIGTWAVRIKEFFKGVWEGVQTMWNIISTVFHYILAPFRWLGDVLGKLGFDFTSLGGQMSTYLAIGKVLGIIIGTVLVIAVISLTIALWNMAVAVLAATWPILLIIAVIAGIIYVISNWGDIMDWLGEKFSAVFEFIGNLLGSFFDWMEGLGDRFWNWGAGIVTSIKDGILSCWDGLVSWFSGLIDALIAPFKDILVWLGLMDDVNVNTSVTNKDLSTPSAIGSSVGNSKAQALNGSTETYTYNKENTKVETIYITMPDGRVLAKVVNDENENKRIRSGG